MIKLIKSTFYHEKETKKKLINFISKSSFLSFGHECKKFEKNFAVWQGRKQCLLLNSGSSANLSVIQALYNLEKIKAGDKVGFSSITWSTNVMPLIQLGLSPIPIDIELSTLNISSRNLLTVLKKDNLKALFITNLLGLCDDLDKIRDICENKKIILIEDNCESLGSVYKGVKLGNFGLASTFSFYVGHHLSTIEGGAVCTDDEELATMLRLVRAHGWDRNLSFSKQKSLRNKYKINTSFYSRYTFYDLGYNLRPTEITGFLGNSQIRFIRDIIKKRESNFYDMATPIYKNTDQFIPLISHHLDVFSNFAVPVIAKSKELKEKLVEKCRDKIEIRPIVGGNITAQPFFHKYVTGLIECPNADIIHNQGLYFGNNPELTKKDKNTIVKLFTSV